MKYPRTIIKFEGEMQISTAERVRFALIKEEGLRVFWSGACELIVIHKKGRRKDASV